MVLEVALVKRRIRAANEELRAGLVELESERAFGRGALLEGSKEEGALRGVKLVSLRRWLTSRTNSVEIGEGGEAKAENTI